MQALRAVAVLLVVLYHLWPARLTGGYVGVDVFFVVSGFLITSHLHREIATRGTVSLTAFYARRARRLLPAAVLVLLATAAATYLFLPVTRWTATAWELLASTFYVQNWVLAGKAVDYSASGAAASAVQHFWSLSVEEQFYLVWPPMILLLLLLARRLPSVRRDDLVLGGILGVTVLSFGYSVYATATDPAAAYFVTPTRVWELGAGAVLALWGLRARPRPAHRRPRPGRGLALRWAGFAAILAAAVTLSSQSAFPGYLALLPVLGTVAVIAAGDTGRRDPSSPVIRSSPVQFLGDVSYSLYLWHWPAIVIAPFVLTRDLRATDKVLLLVLCVLLAWLTKVAVEAPSQRWRLLARPAGTAAFTVVAMVLVSGVALLQWNEVRQQAADAQAALTAAQDDPCFGAAALAPDAPGCADVFAAPDSTTLVEGDEPWFETSACDVVEVPLRVATCRYGSGEPVATVALVGDSHAEHWRGAVHRVAEAMNWEVVEMFRGGCPVTPSVVLSFNGAPMDTDGCHAWGRKVDERLAEEAPDYILTSAFAGAFLFDSPDPGESLERGSAGFAETWDRWAAQGAQVVVLRDIPATGGRNVPECLATHDDDPLECARPRSEAVTPDAMTVAMEQVTSDRVDLIDLTDHFCDESTCYAVIGGSLVYYDYNHISAQFSRSLAPFLLERLSAI